MLARWTPQAGSANAGESRRLELYSKRREDELILNQWETTADSHGRTSCSLHLIPRVVAAFTRAEMDRGVGGPVCLTSSLTSLSGPSALQGIGETRGSL